jgi:hypothetical protein
LAEDRFTPRIFAEFHIVDFNPIAKLLGRY